MAEKQGEEDDFTSEEEDSFGEEEDPFGEEEDSFGEEEDPFGEEEDPFEQFLQERYEKIEEIVGVSRDMLEINAFREDKRRKAEAAVLDAGDDLVSEGTYKSYDNTVYLTGACNVGKTTLASVFIGHDIPKKWHSTDGLVIHFGQNGIDLISSKMVPLQEDSNIFSKVLRGQPEVIQSEANPYNDGERTGHQHNTQPKPTTASVTSTTKGRGKSVSEQQCFKLGEEFLGGVRSGRYYIYIAPSDLVDFGGQRSFDMTHQLFIRQNGAFVVMFDGRYGFLEYLKDYPGINVTNEEIVKHWVNSILTYCIEGESTLPMILFAATHRDAFSKEEINLKKDEFVAKLKFYFGNHPKKNHIVLDEIYFINATNKNDPEIKRLQDHLVKIAKRQPSWGKRMPVRWVPLEMQMSSMKKNHEYIVSKKNLVEANALNGDLALTEDQLEKFLSYHHSTGKIMHISQAGLDEFVVLYPPAIVNILRSFVTDKMFWPKGEIADILEMTYKTGKILKTDLEEIWSQEWVPIKDLEVRNFVIKLLVHLDVLIIPCQYGKISNFSLNTFLLPCVVKEQLSMAFLKDERFMDRTISLVFSIRNHVVPPALAYKLIGAVSSIWPLKEEGGITCLFQFAAVLTIDLDNELMIFVQDYQIIAYLTNTKSKSMISPDVASSIQECLINTLDYALNFYFTNMGRNKTTIQSSEMYDIQIGEICNKKPCVTTVAEAKEKSERICSHGRCHQSDVALRWIFVRTQKMYTCSETCRGIDSRNIGEHIENHFLLRLAGLLGVDCFGDLMTQLGLTTDEQKNLRGKYTEPTLLVFMGLVQWRETNTTFTSDPNISDIQSALIKIGDKRHHFCQIERNPLDALAIGKNELQGIPDDKVLKELARNMGNCAMHLGVEFRLKIPVIEDIIYKHPKSLFDQNECVLMEWKKRFGRKATILYLMEVVSRTKQGVGFLKETYLK